MYNRRRQHARYLYAVIFVGIAILLGVCVAFVVRSRDRALLSEQTDLPTASENLTVSLNSNQYVRIDVEVADGNEYAEILSAGSGSDCRTELYYIDICDVRIEVDGTVWYFEDAIRENLISLEQIYAYSRIDARLGCCETFTKVRNGLTFLVFRYPEYELWFTYDYYFLSDGEHRLVNELYISKNRYDVNSSANRVVQEDWGLAFEVSEVNSSSITLHCTQHGGQQLGELIIDFFYIESIREQDSINMVNDFADIESYQQKIVIPRGRVSEITLDWADIYGALSPGDYLMGLKVRDVYDPANAQPLMSKFETSQSYTIPFVIP